jgi:hypothetical protein
MSQEHDKIIKLVQSSTRSILGNYRERAELLRECFEDVKLLIREGHDPEIAQRTAERLFGTKDNVSFLAIDGTMSQDEALEMVIFYASIKFIHHQTKYSKRKRVKRKLYRKMITTL